MLLSELCTLGKSPYPGEGVFRIEFLERLEASNSLEAKQPKKWVRVIASISFAYPHVRRTPMRALGTGR